MYQVLQFIRVNLPVMLAGSPIKSRLSFNHLGMLRHGSRT